MPTSARTPIGRLMKNTHRHDSESVNHPPRVGPINGPSIEPRLNTAIADACFDGGLISSSVACAIGTSPAPHAPWISRAITIIGRLLDTPHSSEARVNPVTEAITRSLRP